MKQKLMLIAVVCFLSLSEAMAQPSNPNNPTPFGFVEVLALGGAALGARKIMKQKKSNNHDD